MVKKFISYYKPYKKLFLLDMLTALIAAICDLIYPYMTKELINISIPNKNLRMIIVFAIVLIIIFLIKALCTYFMQYWGHVVGVRMQGDMRRDVFTHLQKLPNTYFDNNKTGDIMSKIVNDLIEISELARNKALSYGAYSRGERPASLSWYRLYDRGGGGTPHT